MKSVEISLLFHLDKKNPEKWENKPLQLLLKNQYFLIV